MKLIVLVLLWLPDGWLGGDIDSCRTIVFNGHGPNCTTTYPATWKWFINNQLQVTIEDSPLAVMTIPPRYETKVSFTLVAKATDCPLSGQFVITPEWLQVNNNYPPPRTPCSQEFETIFVDSFETSNLSSWSKVIGYDPNLIFQDNFELGTLERWN